MSVKQTNKVVPITLTEFHVRKLNLMCRRAGLSKTAIMQRLIEQFQLFDPSGTNDMKNEPPSDT